MTSYEAVNVVATVKPDERGRFNLKKHIQQATEYRLPTFPDGTIMLRPVTS